MKGTSTCNISNQRDPQGEARRTKRVSAKQCRVSRGETPDIRSPGPVPHFYALRLNTQPWPPSKRAQ